MKKLIFFLIPLILLGCGESEERDILRDVTGVWSAKTYDGTTVFEVNFDDSVKTFRLIYSPTDYNKKWENEIDIDDLYDVSIKNIEKRNNIVSFYLTKRGESFKEPMRENPIWTIRQHFGWNDDEYTISLTTHKGDNYDLGWVRDY